jgi:SAM-dependent methyltransferase
MESEPPGWVNAGEILSPEVYLYFYSDFLNPERTRRDADFLERALEPPPGGRLLDIGCGTGRLSNLLAVRGYRVTAIDVSEPYLQIAQGDAACLNLRVDYRRQDMRAIEFEEEFDAAFCYFTTFGFFCDAENADVLRRVARALKPGGRFLIETTNRDAILRMPPGHRVIERNGNFQIDHSHYDPLTGRLQTTRTVILHGSQRSGSFSVRVFTACELIHWLEESGLEYAALYGETGAPYSMQGIRMAVAGRKPTRSSPPSP